MSILHAKVIFAFAAAMLLLSHFTARTLTGIRTPNRVSRSSRGLLRVALRSRVPHWNYPSHSNH
ncbi:MAG: hypothetical protein WBX16_22535, partial [Candidatus Acidiferrales bacterium]